ncbi:uncharacterized protein KY384_004547 [Bacidia gigantensis]|uniref:uncharacterized protein n=1 Tax=Bacidia gigantensis TaxID=2732470 RepID=UPI001D041993|nr:uncharacterized protein KY384_004547 [Bacidia gigantensis]KAG8531189.1 hypothetical protein KY384_004547 [Bacidia gigantensis]
MPGPPKLLTSSMLDGPYVPPPQHWEERIRSELIHCAKSNVLQLRVRGPPLSPTLDNAYREVSDDLMFLFEKYLKTKYMSYPQMETFVDTFLVGTTDEWVASVRKKMKGKRDRRALKTIVDFCEKREFCEDSPGYNWVRHGDVGDKYDKRKQVNLPPGCGKSILDISRVLPNHELVELGGREQPFLKHPKQLLDERKPLKASVDSTSIIQPEFPPKQEAFYHPRNVRRPRRVNRKCNF